MLMERAMVVFLTRLLLVLRFPLKTRTAPGAEILVLRRQLIVLSRTRSTAHVDPLNRYRYAKQLRDGGKPYPEFVDAVLPLHDKYWATEDAMAEGNPALALERGEQVKTPPALHIQGANDIVHPRVDLGRFVANYRKAGGHVQPELFEDAAEGFMKHAASRAATQAMKKIIEFVHQQVC